MPNQSPIAKKIVEGAVREKPKGKKSVSYSQYSIYKECPFRWQLTYKQGLFPFTSNINSVFGTSFHECLQEYLRLLYTVSVKASDEMNFEEYLSDRLLATYKDEMKENGGQHFLPKEELKEYYHDGIQILDYLRRKRKVLFDYRQWDLVAIELPLYTPILEGNDNILFNGYLDLLFYNPEEKIFRVLDIKTSTRGWSAKYHHSDLLKMSQVLLYKHYLAKHYNLNPDDISGEYLIVKRKIMEDSEWPIPRHQTHIPAQGSARIKLAVNGLEAFVKDVFNEDGSFQEKEYPKHPSSSACKFCPYAGHPDMCDQKPGYNE